MSLFNSITFPHSSTDTEVKAISWKCMPYHRARYVARAWFNNQSPMLSEWELHWSRVELLGVLSCLCAGSINYCGTELSGLKENVQPHWNSRFFRFPRLARNSHTLRNCLLICFFPQNPINYQNLLSINKISFLSVFFCLSFPTLTVFCTLGPN